MVNRVDVLDQRATFESDLTLFDGGINNSVSDEFISIHELSDARNYTPDPSLPGALRKRDGLTKRLVTQQVNGFRSIYQGQNNIFFTTTTLCKDYLNNTLFTSGATSNLWDWTSAQGADIFVNTTDVPQKITAGGGAASVALGGTPPVMRNIKWFNNFLFGIPQVTNTVLRWTDVGTIETWTSLNTLTIGTSDNILMGLMPFHDVLMVFAEKSFYHITGFATLEIGISYKSYDEGCASPRSIVVTPYGITWWGTRNGLVISKSGFGASGLDMPMKRKIPATLNSIAGNAFHFVGTWNPIHERIEMYVATATDNVINLGIFYYPAQDTFYLMNGAGVAAGACCTIYPSPSGAGTTLSGAPVILLGSTGASGYLYNQAGVDDDGVAITAYAESKRDGGMPEHPQTTVSHFHGVNAAKRVEALTLHNYGAGVSQAFTYGIYENDDTAVTTSYTVTTNTGANKPTDNQIGYGRYLNKWKHRVSDSLGSITRVRGFSARGVIATQ